MVKGTVLVVDDAPGIVHLLQLLLEQAGYRVVTAVGEAVLPLAREVRPDVILLDVMMPGLGGVELGTTLHDDPATANIPVIAISALNHLKLRMQGVKMRAVDCVSKPFDLDDVLHRVEKWVAIATGTSAPHGTVPCEHGAVVQSVEQRVAPYARVAITTGH